MENGSAATMGFIATLFLLYATVLLALVAFSIWIYWRVFAKAGYNGALSLLNLVPGVGQLICMIVLAFGRWPIEDEVAALRGEGPLHSRPPGTSVMPSP